MTHFQKETLNRATFFALLAMLVVIIAGSAQAQNTVQNFTNNENIKEMVERGLQELDIENTTVTILPLRDYYKSAKQKTNGKPWGITIGANKRIFTLVISTRHEAEVGLSFEERIAHELIHIKQGYKGRQGNEKEAYNRQHSLAELIQ